MQEKAIEALIEIKAETTKINDSYSLTNWKNKATNLLIRLYGKDSSPIQQIGELTYSPGYNGRNNVAQRREQASELVESLIKEINRFGLPEIFAKTESGLNINITQSQNQETKINLSVIIESIQQELTGGQLKEIQKIIEDKKIEGDEKKSKIVEKLKQFGSELATNILANILTNPSLYS